MSQFKYSWSTKFGDVELDFDNGKTTFKLKRGDACVTIPAYQITGMPDTCDLQTLQAYLQNTYLIIAPTSNDSYSLTIQGRLLGGANIIDPKTESNQLWPRGVIPFEIDTTTYPVDQNGRAIILSAIEKWNNAQTGFVLIPRTNQENYLVFGEDTNVCHSNVGYQGGRQYIRCDLDGGGFNEHSIMHEIGHAIGFHHEHQRADRDNYLFIEPGADSVNYGKTPTKNQYGPYDFGSIMHYYLGDKLKAWSSVLNATQANAVGKQPTLSTGDLAAARYLASFAQKKISTPTTTRQRRTPNQSIFKPVHEELSQKADRAYQTQDFRIAVRFYLTLISEYKNVMPKQTVANWLLNYGYCQYQLGNQVEAKNGFEIALQYNPSLQQARRNLEIMQQESQACIIC